MSEDRRPFPLGVPVNRASSERMWQPIAGRPGWFKHRLTGKEIYIERPKPVTILLFTT